MTLVMFLSVASAIIGVLAEVQGRMKVIIVAFGTTAPSGIASLSVIGPPLQMAVDSLNARNGSLELSFFLSPARACLMAAQTPEAVLAEWYYLLQTNDTVTVYVTGSESSCQATDLSVLSLIANWNKISINTVGGAEARKDLPTSLGLSVACSPCFQLFAINVINHYDWRSVFILADSSSPPAYTFIGGGIAQRLKQAGRRTFYFTQIASNSNTSFVDILQKFHDVSRVLFFFGHARKLRELLITASSMNMTNGQHIFVAMEILTYVAYGNLTWQYGDQHDLVAKEAFRSLLVLQPIRPTLPTNTFSNQFLQECLRRSATQFNTTLVADNGLLQYLTASYTAIKILGQVFEEALAKNLDLADARRLMDALVNRTFHTDFQDVFIDANGIRVEDLALAHYNIYTDKREAFLVQFANAINGLLRDIGRVAGWPEQQAWPPPSVPRCGFRNEKDECKQSTLFDRYTVNLHILGSKTDVAAALYGSACGCVLILTGAFLYLRALLAQGEWWLIPATDLNYADGYRRIHEYIKRSMRADSFWNIFRSENK